MSALHLPGRLDQRVLLGAGWRATLVVVAAVAVALELSPWARLPLSSAAVLGVATFFHRRSGRRGVLGVVLVVAGGGLVALALLGLLLDVLPTGIDPLGWGLAIGTTELLVLAFVALFLPAAEGSRALRRRFPVAGIAWGGVAVLVLAGAVVYSTVSFDATHVSPLAIAAVPHGDSVTVTVSAGRDQGPYELDLVTTDGRTVIAKSVRASGAASYTTSIPMPATRAVLQLVAAGSTTPVRQLILDDTAATK
ncbi:MAG: hypothetical protein HIU86_09700 [Acidobacteria bacterium]|nr:hypothetical protein [Acidobacteriota bacterium]